MSVLMAHRHGPTATPQAYYRRGDANFAMGKYKLALKDLRTVRFTSNWEMLLRSLSQH